MSEGGGKTVLVTIGFDVNLVVRSLLKISLNGRDTLLLVYSLSGGEHEQRKVRSAVETIKEIVSGAGLRHSDVVVSVSDFVGDVARLVEVLKEHGARRLVASLVGGMRLMIFEVLTAVLVYKVLVNQDAEVSIHVMREDGTYDALLPAEVLYLPELTRREAELLKTLSDKGLLGERKAHIAEEASGLLRISPTMVYKLLASLERKRVLESTDDRVEPTLLGRLIVRVVA